MPIGKIKITSRAKAAIAAALVAAFASGWASTSGDRPVTPVAIHKAIDKGQVPPAVVMAVKVIKSWEGLRTKAYLDTLPKKPVWTVCYGETLNIKSGMTFTPDQCERMLIKRVIHDYYLPLVDGVRDFGLAPDSVQASMISGGYNYGVVKVMRSSGAGFVSKHQYHTACLALTAYNMVGGARLDGLVHRRENGDAQRIGEAELCVSGL
ncbi:glycoside hydrolase [Mesorhizobium sp. LSJC255A00]|uniref:glycoside hydrolase family protein n=1 Tax=Mesorhizobium sp. LSJC255A00 TaxID=1287313 RepID=UPI0003CEEF7B|nr:glycoside hydrolase [Mesorhizobium sp. LSJC255A00]ESX17536.1 glycoside hydrolase [Mesorhizobium sp. LSJC255A00]